MIYHSKGNTTKKGRLHNKRTDIGGPGRGGGRFGPKGILAKGRFHRIDQKKGATIVGKGIIGALVVFGNREPCLWHP